MLLQAMLGLQQDALRGELYIDPALPDWLPDLTLTDLRLARQRFDNRFWRNGKDVPDLARPIVTAQGDAQTKPRSANYSFSG